MIDIKNNHLIHLIINIISSVLFFISCILLFVQTVINIKYNYSSNKIILSEKLIYEQFSHDVYSNINSKILYDFEVYSFNEDCPDDKEPVFFNIKLDSYYDCDGGIIDANEKNIKKDNCAYYNKYSGKISQIVNGFKLCAKKYFYDYEYLLYLNEINNEKKNNCIYFDSYNHCLSDSGIDYENSEIKNQIMKEAITFESQNAIVKNIFSEITPDYLEYETILKQSILNNKKKISSEDQEEVDKYNELNIKTISETFFEDLDDNLKGGNIYYYKIKEINTDLIMSNNNESVFEKYKNNDYIKQKNISWYARNYIGFKNFEELRKFKKNFDENDLTNNFLYKLSQETLFPNIESIFVILIFLGALISSIIIQIKSIKTKKTVKAKEYLISDFVLEILTLSLFIIYSSIYLFIYLYKYKKLDIDMEIYYQKVLYKYNSRINQKYLLASIIILAIILVLLIINYMIMRNIYNTNGENFYSGYTIICILKNMENNKDVNFKFYLNRTFSNEMKRFKQKFFKEYDIDECRFKKIANDIEKEIVIDENKTIKEIGLENNSIIYVQCESRYLDENSFNIIG
jgi:hypothetical protein